jgi:hypothetical protein
MTNWTLEIGYWSFIGIIGIYWILEIEPFVQDASVIL